MLFRGCRKLAILGVYFWDLNKKTQKKVLELYDLKDAKEGNFDVFPLTILEVEL